MTTYHQDVLWDAVHHTLSSFMTPWENLLSCVSLLGIASPPSLQNLKGTMIHIVDYVSLLALAAGKLRTRSLTHL